MLQPQQLQQADETHSLQALRVGRAVGRVAADADGAAATPGGLGDQVPGYGGGAIQDEAVAQVVPENVPPAGDEPGAVGGQYRPVEVDEDVDREQRVGATLQGEPYAAVAQDALVQEGHLVECGKGTERGTRRQH